MSNKRALLKFLIFMTAAITSVQANAGEIMAIAILDFTPKEVPPIVAGAVSDIFRSEFTNYANFVVVERNQMNEILNEQSFQMTGCTDESCAVLVGKLLSARRIITGEITSLGKNFVVTVRYIDVEKGVSLFSEKSVAASIDVIDKTASEVARKLAQRIVSGDKEVLTMKSPAVYYSMSIVPGLGQFYADQPGKGIIFGSLGLAAGAGTLYSYFNYQAKSKAYHDLERGSDEYDSRYNDYKTAAKYYNYSLAVFGAVYLANWIDVLFFSRPDFTGGAEETAAGAIYIDYLCYMNTMTHGEELVYKFSIGYRF